MNVFPLPDELIRKVYGYILPIFEYIHYTKLLTQHKTDEDSDTFSQLLNRVDSPLNIKSIHAKINYYEFIKEYALMMNMRLLNIQEFINDNPLFKKYAKGRVLEGLAPSINEQENHVSNLEKTISKQRTKFYLIGDTCTFKRVVLYDDLAKILSVKGGCLETIIHHCKMNNIPVITGPYSELQRKAGGWSNSKEYRDYLVKKLISL